MGAVIFYEPDDEQYRRIQQVLASAGWPTGMTPIIAGNVSLMETIYSECEGKLLTEAEEFDRGDES